MKTNPFESAKKNVKQAAKIIGLKKEILDEILHIQREVKVTFPVKLKDGTTRIFVGYRVQHNNARGPYKGGIRFHWR